MYFLVDNLKVMQTINTDNFEYLIILYCVPDVGQMLKENEKPSFKIYIYKSIRMILLPCYDQNMLFSKTESSFLLMQEYLLRATSHSGQ